MQRAGGELKSLIRSLGLEEAFRLHLIKSSWSDIIGRPLGRHTSPVSLNKGELLIHASTNARLQDLSFLKAEIIDRLSTFGVKRLRTRVGRLDNAPPRKKKDENYPPPPRELNDKELAFVQELAARIKEPELKEAVRGAARKYLIRVAWEKRLIHG